MMSMSMYRPRKLATVKRSSTEPLELSNRTAIESSNKGGGESSSIPEDRVLSQAQLSDSIRYGGCDRNATNDVRSTKLSMESREDEREFQPGMVARRVEQQQHRKAAIDKLEEFFLGGEPLGSTRKASPVSVLTVPETPGTAAYTPCPKRNMFGQIIEDERVAFEPKFERQQDLRLVSEPDQPMDSGYFLGVELDDDASSISTKESYQPFAKLRVSDRANSLPLECMKSPSNTITKKASLKKISSIGQGLARKNTEGSLQRTVSFTSLSIREYPPSISDNPSCSFGPPVQLDWDYEAEETQLIDHYEESRQPRRANHELLLSYYDRRFLLLKQAGYSRSEVKAAMKEAERVKRQRMVTDIFLPAQAFDETMENFVDSVKKFFGKKSDGE